MRTKATQFNIDYEKTALLFFGSLLTILLAGYLYFVNTGVLSVVERKNIEEKISITGSSVSDLEAEYFAQINAINKGSIESLGFYEPKTISYVSRKSSTNKVFTLNR